MTSVCIASIGIRYDNLNGFVLTIFNFSYVRGPSQKLSLFLEIRKTHHYMQFQVFSLLYLVLLDWSGINFRKEKHPCWYMSYITWFLWLWFVRLFVQPCVLPSSIFCNAALYQMTLKPVRWKVQILVTYGLLYSDGDVPCWIFPCYVLTMSNIFN